MIALLEIRRRKVQFGLIALVVTLISYLVLMINGLGVGLNLLAGSALKSFDADAIAYSRQSGLSVIRSELGQQTTDAIAANPGVRAAASLGYVAANYRRSDGSVKSAAFLGYDPGTIGEPPVVAGRRLTEADADGLLADSRFLRAAGLDVGDEIDVTIRLETRRFVIRGEIDEGAFFFQPAVYLLRSTWRELKYGGADPATPVASVVLLKGANLPGRLGDGFEVVDKDTAFASIEGVSGQQSTVTALRAFGYVIGSLVIGVFFYVLTLQKLPQIGMLKAIGASNTFVLRQLVIQVVVLSLVGLAVAVPLAAATDRALARLPDSVPIAFTTGTFVTTSTLLVVTALLGVLVSARQVLKVDPLIALGQQQ
ncbi:MAG: ABC transporter permease [Dehalococcoidia bacterium]|nr:ABC transporter permease [Dehalococcoidia bacterium]